MGKARRLDKQSNIEVEPVEETESKLSPQTVSYCVQL